MSEWVVEGSLVDVFDDDWGVAKLPLQRRLRR